MDILPINHPDAGYGRCEGKTFRRLMESFLQASAGNHVYYIVNNMNMRRFIFNRAMDIVRAYFGENVQYNGKRYENFEIKFPQGGFIRIVNEHEWNRNPVPSDVMSNHVVIEMDDRHETY